jgi:hypothetical protein
VDFSGFYVRSATNSSGDSAGGVPPGFDLSLEYAPILPLYGFLFDELGRGLHPPGFSLRAALIPLQRPWGDLGLELSPSWNLLSSGGFRVHMGALGLRGVYHRRFLNDALALVARLGVGANFFYGTREKEASQEPLSTWIWSISGGLSFRWYLPSANPSRWKTERNFLETGVEYTHMFSADSPQPGYLRPSFGFGWRL